MDCLCCRAKRKVSMKNIEGIRKVMGEIQVIEPHDP